MAVDDHAIDSLRVWFDIEYEDLKKEWKSNKYEKLSDCPSFKGANAYREAMNVLIKACYLPEYLEAHKIKPLKQMLDEELEIEEFWESRK
jgi:hypothetical protein